MIRVRTAASLAGSPEIWSLFSRAAAPLASVTSRFATPSDFASSLISASLAAPSLGGAVSRTASHWRPSSVVTTPSIASRDAFGLTRTARLTPSASFSQALRGPTS
jgi:hypothetical protein